MLIDREPRAIEPLPAAYHALLTRALDAAEPDERVRGLWLAGSLARGVADAGSDLDLIVAIRDYDFDAFAAGWRDWLSAITPVLLAKPIPNSNLIFSALTEACCRIDGVLEPASRTPTSFSRYRTPVLDRDGLTALVPAPADRCRPGRDRWRRWHVAHAPRRQRHGVHHRQGGLSAAQVRAASNR